MAAHFLARAGSQKLQSLPSAWCFAFEQRVFASHAATISLNEHGHVVKQGETCVEDGHGHGHEEHGFYAHKEPSYKEFIGTREIVGYGWNGYPSYADSFIWPYPAVRFRRPDARYDELHKKELGSWKNLTKDEKKELYRYNFCETYAEFDGPNGYGRSMVGLYFFWIAIALWGIIFVKSISPPLPETFSDEGRLWQVKRMIDMRVNPVDGLASKWDYEKGRWKE